MPSLQETLPSVSTYDPLPTPPQRFQRTTEHGHKVTGNARTKAVILILVREQGTPNRKKEKTSQKKGDTREFLLGTRERESLLGGRPSLIPFIISDATDKI